MTKIDLKDRKILYELDLNCRQSNTQIGKKVGLKKDVVSYRIKKLEDKGVIKNYWTDINTFKLGYNVFRIFINFQYVTPDIKKQIIEHFVSYKNSWAVLSDKGDIDLAVIIWAKNIHEFYQFLGQTLDKYEKYFEKYAISIYVQGHAYKKSFLFEDKKDEENRVININTCGKKPLEIDELDHNLLNEIAINARIPILDLAEKIGCSSQTVNYRIKNLKEQGVIQAFRVNLNLSKLNLQHYKVNIYLKDHKLKKPIFDYLKQKPYLEFMNLAMGWADLEPEIVVKDFQKLMEIFEDIQTKFPGSIKKQSFVITEQLHKLRCMPEL